MRRSRALLGGGSLDFLRMRPERTVQKHPAIQHRPLGLEVSQVHPGVLAQKAAANENAALPAFGKRCVQTEKPAVGC